MKIFYSHCKSLFGTAQENRDIILLSQLGFSVVNPGSPKIAEEFAAWKEAHDEEDPMQYFLDLVDECQALAFRGLPFTNKIPAGVYAEILHALGRIPIIELPTNIGSRGLSVEVTREYLREAGER